MSKIQVDAIEQQTACGTTLTAGGGAGKTVVVDATTVTLGRCGGTVALASGATQTGFGRTGTVDWDTTAKTATFTGVSGNGYFVNTTGGVVTVNLPASPSAGDIVAVADYAGTADSNNITIGRNGSNINGAAADLTIEQENAAVTLVYVDGTQGWKATDTSSLNDIALQPSFITATGGTITFSGDCKYHTFTGPGTFSVSSLGNPLGGPNNACFMVVAGGGGGQQASGGGAGGAGGFRTATSSPISITTYPVTVGAGGAISTTTGVAGDCGSNTVFNSITSTGGGGGGAGWTGPSNAPPTEQGQPGGSGGGGGARYATGGGSGTAPGGTGNTPATPVSQGNPGGDGSPNNNLPGMNAGGGGGASAAGTAGNTSAGGAGGAGSPVVPIFGPTQPFYLPGPDSGFFAGGGGGFSFGPTSSAPAGGIGGGGNGSSPAAGGEAGSTNSGGGGGGAPAGNGGSGIVVIKYKFQ